MQKLWLLLIVFSILAGCRERQPGTLSTTFTSVDSLRYATGFRVTRYDGYKKLEVLSPYPDARSGYTYLLVDRGKPVPAHDTTTTVITVPVTRLVCTSTTHVPALDYLDETDALVGFPSTDYISSRKMRRRIDEGHVQELGIDKGMNLEKLVELKPSLVIGYTMNSDLGQLKKVRELGIPVVVNSEYLEKHPLGRAEWIKFMALFFNKEQKADSVFRIIESGYNSTLNQVRDVKSKPTVMSGIVYGDTWYLPGGKNYAGRLFEDAGCNYLWADDPSNGFLEFRFEAVFQKARDADLWIGVGSYRSLDEIKAAEARYARFKAFQRSQVYTYNARQGDKGGSEYLELGYLRPDLILKDLVKIAHPDLLPGYELYFYARLR